MPAARSRSERFRPTAWLPGPHLQTILPSFFPSSVPNRRGESILVEVGLGTRIRLEIARPEGRVNGTLVLVHGLLGSAESGYMRRTARIALDRSWIAARVNLRNCGRTETLSRTLHNAGQSGDVERILEDLDRAGFPRPFALVGFSLGGNLVLRYAGLAGERSHAQAVAAISPPIDLESTVASLESRRNILYHGYFTQGLCRQIRRIRRFRPVPGPRANPLRIRSVRTFDSRFTAPDGGYDSAEHYYRVASAAPHLASIRVPGLIVSSLDDPIVPSRIFDPTRLHPPAMLRFLHPRRGGHVGFWQSARPHFWAGAEVLDFLDRITIP